LNFPDGLLTPDRNTILCPPTGLHFDRPSRHQHRANQYHANQHPVVPEIFNRQTDSMHRFNYHNRRCHQEAEPQAALSPAERLAHAVCKPLSYPGLTPPEPRFSTSCRSVFERPFPAAEYSVAAVCQHSL